MLNIEAQEGKVKALLEFMPTVWECAGRVHGYDLGQSIGVVEDVCLAETKVRVTFPCDNPLDFTMELEYEERVLSVKLKYEKLNEFSNNHGLTHDATLCQQRVIRPEPERVYNRRSDWDDRRDGKDRRFRNNGEERNQMMQARNIGETSRPQNGGRGRGIHRDNHCRDNCYKNLQQPWRKESSERIN
ncbi:unnamed protein product [Cochlearia groenlandica]